jgi:hypothetical protein
MTRRRWYSLAIAAGAAVCVLGAGASALAANHSTHSNYRGPARPAVAAAARGSGSQHPNYRGPARGPAARAVVHGSNLPAAGQNNKRN